MERLAYRIVDRLFDSFVKNSLKAIDSVAYGIYPVTDALDSIAPIKVGGHKIGGLAILWEPFNVRFIGKRDGGDTTIVEFFDCNMDKIYTYDMS